MRALITLLAFAAVAPAQVRNVIFVMTDGLRWQEVFTGADPALMNKESGVPNLERTRRDFWRDTPEARRTALFPFLWSTVAKQGQIYGNLPAGSDAHVTNGRNFSYPGYNETLTGAPDNRIDSNDKKPNPNVNVLEWLNQKPAYKGKVAAFASWDTFPFILNAQRAGIPVIAGFDPLTTPPISPQLALLNRIKRETEIWEAEPLDALTFHTAVDYVKTHKPRVLFLSLGDTDEWAHSGQYDLYLRAAHRFDQYVKELWETVQSMPQYKGATALVLCVDHGRGVAPKGWRDHGEKVPESKNIWMAFMGPGVKPLGERKQAPEVTQSQVAATLAALLGENFQESSPKVASPVADVTGTPRASARPR